MSTEFRGPIAEGRIKAEFASDFSNADADLLVISTAQIGGSNPRMDQQAASPGGFARVGIDAMAPGILEVWVAIGAESDSGRLRITANDTTIDDEAISGSIRWVYSVETE